MLRQGSSDPKNIEFSDISWSAPTYTVIHGVLKSPVYAGAYVYGRTRHERCLDPAGRMRTRMRQLPRTEWAVLLRDHHQGFIDWETYEVNQARLATNTRPQPHDPAGAVREGAALLQGLAVCGTCSRKLLVYYQGRNSTPGYYCANGQIVNGRSQRCLRVGAVHLDRAVAQAFLEEVAATGPDAALQAEKRLQEEWEASVAQWRVQAERLEYQARLAERHYRAADPDNRLVAATLEAEWERKLAELAAARAELAGREQRRPAQLRQEELRRLQALGEDLPKVWSAASTTDRDRKELLRSLLEAVALRLDREARPATVRLVLRWRGGLVSELLVPLPARRTPALRTDEDTVELVRRLAAHYPDAMIAGILGRQGRTTATGVPFTANRVGNLRRHWQIPCFRPAIAAEGSELLTVAKAAELLAVAPSTLHRWIADGFIPAEQITPGAPWRIRLTDELRCQFRQEAPNGYLTMKEAMRELGVSRQTVLQRVKDGRLDAVHVRTGRSKGLSIRLPERQPSLFESLSSAGV